MPTNDACLSRERGQAKAAAPYSRIGGMRKLRRNVIQALGGLDLAKMHKLI